MQCGGRTRTVLFEVVIVVLFLSLSTVTVLGLFATAYKTSEDEQQATLTFQLAQDALERLSAGVEQDGRSVCLVDGREYRVSILTQDQPSDAGVLRRYTVRVETDARVLAEVQTAWYWPEVNP